MSRVLIAKTMSAVVAEVVVEDLTINQSAEVSPCNPTQYSRGDYTHSTA
jgi:hypothetical protein